MAPDHVREGMTTFPFSAIVGNDRAKTALVCALSSPGSASLLICGPKGSGKTTLARSASCVCGERTVVTMPINATEDSVFGGLDIGSTIQDGRKRSSLSLLARSDGNILLIENINLFPQHIVHQVLNAVETHMNIVERDGISEVQGCSPTLIATMDPEEGGLSDHILDRFDMCVFMDRLEDESARESVVERRTSYESDPGSFCGLYSEGDEDIARRISDARIRVRYTRVPEGYCEAISEVCSRLKVSGHRGDISMMNVSCVIAALDDRDFASLDDLKEAAAICLEHRRNDSTDEESPQGGESPECDGEDQGEDNDDEGRQDRDRDDEESPDMDLPPPPPTDPGPSDSEVFTIGDTFRVVDYMPKDRYPLGSDRSGRHEGTITNDRSGRCVGYRVPTGKTSDIALVASIRAAAPYQVLRRHDGLAIVLSKEDIREKVREKKQGRNILFMVDGSGSIGAQKRMVAVKGAILSMLKDAYQKRDSIGMGVFRVNRAEEVLPLTRSILNAYHVLSEIPTGGRTPLTHALIKGYEILKEHIGQDSAPVMVILSDGRCNVPYTQGMKPVDEMLGTARALTDSGIKFIVIDTESGRMKFGLALDLCMALGGTYLKLEDLDAEHIERSVRLAMDA